MKDWNTVVLVKGVLASSGILETMLSVSLPTASQSHSVSNQKISIYLTRKRFYDFFWNCSCWPGIGNKSICQAWWFRRNWWTVLFYDISSVYFFSDNVCFRTISILWHFLSTSFEFSCEIPKKKEKIQRN